MSSRRPADQAEQSRVVVGEERRQQEHEQGAQAVEAVHPAAGRILVGWRQEDLNCPEQEEEKAPADPFPEAPERGERGEEDDQLRAVDDQAAGEAVRVERAVTGSREVRGDEIDLQRHRGDDDRQEDEMDPGGCAIFHARDPNRVAPGDARVRSVVLSDRTIERLLEEGLIEIEPYDSALLQPSSVDVRVDRYFRVFHNSRYPYIDVKEPQEDLTELVEIDDDRAFILHPGEFVLGSTLERIKLPDDLVARLEGKSSLGRLGLLIHSTAGFIDPGWDGHVTLELSNVANLPITIYYGMKIGQLSFVQLTEPAEKPYGADELGSKYQGQQGPTPSRYWQNFEREPAK